MSCHIEIYDAENYLSYEAAKRAGAVYSLDRIEISDQYGFAGGTGADLVQAMRLALHMIGQSRRLGAVLVSNNPIIERLN